MAEDGDGPLGPIEPLPIEGLPAHLEAEMAGGGAFGALRAASGAWLRSDPAGEALARALVDLEAPLGRSYLLDQPDVAGMGVGAWGLAVALPATPLA
ncbi:MAG: hypothetical protein KC620_23070, partial [Myxococcales bacterium]|nr:hypothetical protein [Myxococcales bacterium]